jgi:putative spermidine/putrescine transport system permease protein
VNVVKLRIGFYTSLLFYSILGFLLIPFLILFLWAFSKNWPWPDLLPHSLSTRGWESIADIKFIKVLLHSIFLSITVTFLVLVISIPAAKALAFYNFRGRNVLQMLILAPIVIPPMAVTMGIHINFIKLGLTDTFWGVVLVHLIPTIPYAVRILAHVFEAVGWNIEEQARVLGAKNWQIFLYITLPLIAPGLFSAGVLCFIISFSQYILTFMIGGGRVMTITMELFPYVASGDRTIASVYSLIFILTTLTFAFLVDRFTRENYEKGNHFYL